MINNNNNNKLKKIILIRIRIRILRGKRALFFKKETNKCGMKPAPWKCRI